MAHRAPAEQFEEEEERHPDAFIADFDERSIAYALEKNKGNVDSLAQVASLEHIVREVDRGMIPLELLPTDIRLIRALNTDLPGKSEDRDHATSILRNYFSSLSTCGGDKNAIAQICMIAQLELGALETERKKRAAQAPENAIGDMVARLSEDDHELALALARLEEMGETHGDDIDLAFEALEAQKPEEHGEQMTVENVKDEVIALREQIRTAKEALVAWAEHSVPVSGTDNDTLRVLRAIDHHTIRINKALALLEKDVTQFFLIPDPSPKSIERMHATCQSVQTVVDSALEAIQRKDDHGEGEDLSMAA